MFFALTVIALLFTISGDYYIFRRIGRKYRTIWAIQSILFVLPPLVMNVSGLFIDNRSSSWMLVSMWILWVFIAQFLFKIFIVIAIFVREKTGKSFLPIAILLSILMTGAYVYGNFVSRCQVKVKRVEISSADLPESFDGYKIVQFSDVHLGTMFLDRNLLSRVVDTINYLNPDIVIQSGDLVNIHANELTENRINELKRIKTPVCSVLGNHDLGFYLRDTTYESPKVSIDALCKTETEIFKWRILRNENISINKGSDSIFISGVVYPNDINHHNFNSTYGGSDIRKAMNGISRDAFSILISHTPVLIDSLPEKSDAVDLMLSGHVHAMQLKIGNFCPAFMLYKESSGYYFKNNVSLYVNDGIGVVGHPFRFGAPPEITLITLKKL